MTDPFSQIAKNFINDRYYREYLRLLFLYGRVPRFQSREIKFLDYTIQVPDFLSFIYQFKEIFVKQYYRFPAASKTPVIYDCGSNIGVSLLFYKTTYAHPKIKAFEADKKLAGLLSENLRINGITDIEVFPKAVWVNNDGVEFYSDVADAGTIYGEGNKMMVDTIRLKDLIENEESVDFLKLDVEGAEAEIISDMGNRLNKIKNLFIEYHSFISRRQELDKILQILSDNSFRYFINSVYDKKIPFENRMNSQNPMMDLQLNIFAYK